MLKKRGLLELILKLLFNPKVIIDLDSNKTPKIVKAPFMSFNNAVIVSVVVLLSFIPIPILLQNEPLILMIMGNLFLSTLEVTVVLILFYTAKLLYKPGKNMKITWLIIMGIAVFFHVVGDIWRIMGNFMHPQQFSLIINVFYVLFYLMFALSIYYLPKVPLSRNNELKLIADTSIIGITVLLILGIFLIVPAINLGTNFISSILSTSYVIGDIILFLWILNVVFTNFKNVYQSSMIFLGASIVFRIVTDSFYISQSSQGTYIPGGLLDAGWILSFVFIVLAAILQINIATYGRENIRFNVSIQNLNFSSYLPLLGVAVAYILLIWTNHNLTSPNSVYVEVSVGATIFLLLLRQALTLHENKNLYSAAQREISNRKVVEKKLKESEKKYRDLTELLPQSVYESDLNGNITFANHFGLEAIGYGQEDVVNGLNKFQILDPEDHDKVVEDVQRMLNGEGMSTGEYTAVKKDGTSFPVMMYANPIIHENQITGLRCVAVDITEIKKAENEIKASLEEKELLLKEIHHRVKNNLQIVSSLLDLQANYVNEEEAINILRESQNRIKSMALIHETLYKSTDLTSIEFQGYVQNLVYDLFHSYDLKSSIKPVVDVDPVFLNIETAIPCGLIISELVSNSLKHAFQNKMSGEVLISIRSCNNEFELTVMDDGTGFPENIDFRNVQSSLGLRLVTMLVKQLDGSIELDKNNGTKFIIKFKELEYKKRF